MKKGISLVALVITIIVLIILTATVILSAFNNGMLDRSEEAVFKNNIRTFQEDFANKRLKAQNKNYTDINGEKIDVNSIDASNAEGNITEWIPSITNEFIDKIFIQQGLFKADKTKFTDQQIAWLEDLGIEMGMTPVIGTTEIWQLDETKTKLVAYLGEDINNDKDFTIPRKVKDKDTNKIYTIKEVGDIFNGKEISIKRMIIPDNLTFNTDITTGDNMSMVGLDIGDNVTFNNGMICDQVFKSRYHYQVGNDYSVHDGNIIIGDNLTVKGESALVGSHVTNIVIGNNATLPSNSLNSCEQLEKITIGKSLCLTDSTTKVCLTDNDILTQLSIGSFKQIGSATFTGNTILEKIVIENGCTITSTDAFSNCTGIKEITLGNATISSTGVFKGCTGLEKVTIGKGAGANFPNGLFSQNTNIKTVIFEDNSTAIITMFSGCSAMTDLKIGNNVTLTRNCFINCKGLTSLKIPGSTNISTIASESTTIFVNCSNLATVELGEGLKNISASMFANATSLNNITIPKSVEFIGSRAFGGTGLTDVVVLSDKVQISSAAFSGSQSLKTIKFNKATVQINSDSFANCTGLNNIEFNDTIENVKKIVGYDKQWGATNATIYCTDGTITGGVVTKN